jgi:hypothetical protein
MNFWEVINSPLILTIVSLIWGSLIASWVTALWQKRSYHHQIKLQYAQEIISIYQEYLRLIRSETANISRGDFDKIHPRMVASAKLINLLFWNKRIGQIWLSVTNKLNSTCDLRIQERDRSLIDRKLRDIYPEADKAIETMFNELA